MCNGLDNMAWFKCANIRVLAVTQFNYPPLKPFIFLYECVYLWKPAFYKWVEEWRTLGNLAVYYCLNICISIEGIILVEKKYNQLFEIWFYNPKIMYNLNESGVIVSQRVL